MWTFTIDPKRFHSPEQAYRHVMKKRMLAKFVAAMKKAGHLITQRYYWVIEFHKSGWPHWHLILETSYVPKDDAQAVWNRLGTGDSGELFGFIAFSKGMGSRDDKKRFKNSRHAAYYIMKYVIKEPENGWPQWVLAYQGNIMRCRGSNGLFKAADIEAGRKALEEEAERPKKTRGKYRRKNTISLRISSCGDAALVFVHQGHDFRYLGRVPHAAEDLEQWFGESLDKIELPYPGEDEATDRLLWAWLGFSEKPRGRVVLAAGGILELGEAPGMWRPDDDWNTPSPRADECPEFDDPEWIGE